MVVLLCCVANRARPGDRHVAQRHVMARWNDWSGPTRMLADERSASVHGSCSVARL